MTPSTPWKNNRGEPKKQRHVPQLTRGLQWDHAIRLAKTAYETSDNREKWVFVSHDYCCIVSTRLKMTILNLKTFIWSHFLLYPHFFYSISGKISWKNCSYSLSQISLLPLQDSCIIYRAQCKTEMWDPYWKLLIIQTQRPKGISLHVNFSDIGPCNYPGHNTHEIGPAPLPSEPTQTKSQLQSILLNSTRWCQHWI